MWVVDCFFTIAAVFQIGPDDVFLRETENAESSSSHGCVNSHTRVCHQLRSLVKPCPKQNTRRDLKKDFIYVVCCSLDILTIVKFCEIICFLDLA